MEVELAEVRDFLAGHPPFEHPDLAVTGLLLRAGRRALMP